MPDIKKDFLLFRYNSYNHYIKSQLEKTERLRKGNERATWLSEIMFEFVYNNISKFHKITNTDFIICHGVRFGYEVEFFRKKFLVEKIYSTELCDGVFLFDETNLFIMDFDKDMKEWRNKFDILYSNSIDHSRNPIETLDIWSKSLKVGAIMYLTIPWDDKVKDKDCFCLAKDDNDNRCNYIQKVENLIAPISNLRLIHCTELYKRTSDGIYEYSDIDTSAGDVILKRVK